MRRTLLDERVKADGETSIAMLRGSLLHELVQDQMVNGPSMDPSSGMEAKITDVVRSCTGDLWSTGTSETEMSEELLKALPKIQEWADTYLLASPRGGPKDRATIRVGGGGSLLRSPPVRGWIQKVLDIEETVSSSTYGLKGKVDATVQFHRQERSTIPGVPEKESVWTLPLEIKTGRSTQVIEHRAQTSLYSLLLSDRLGKLCREKRSVEEVYGVMSKR